MKQLPLPIGLAPRPSFETFIVGGNAPAVEHLQGLSSGAITAAAPVYLWGDAGCGKTHLLRACADAWQARGATARCFDAGAPPPWPVTARTLVLLDDCDAFDAAQQHAAFACFVESAGLGLPVLAAGRLPPVDLPLREDLRTRLGWGLVFAIQPLPEAETRAALAREAKRRGLHLPEDVTDFLLKRFARDLKHLSAQLDALDVYALTHKRVVSLALLRQMLAEEAAP